ncbi:hypothetical protein [Chromatium okenii]|uniref:hypothetical protein n=1 Tax=Chromatium okenii TaxID=61644 RepID=UPI0011B022FF|nr:hypothetical protein [Chromatium okenii]
MPTAAPLDPDAEFCLRQAVKHIFTLARDGIVITDRIPRITAVIRLLRALPVIPKPKRVDKIPAFSNPVIIPGVLSRNVGHAGENWMLAR